MQQIIKIISLSIILLGALNAQSQCPKYDLAMQSGNQYFKKGNYEKAINKFLAAQIAARECNLKIDEPAKQLKKVFRTLEKLKNDAIEAEKKAKDAEKAIKKELAKTDTLKQYIKNIGGADNAYDYLYKEGSRLFEIIGDYKGALLHLSNARLINENDSVIRKIRLSEFGIYTDKLFHKGNIEAARVNYMIIKSKSQLDTTFAQIMIDEIVNIQKVWKEKTSNLTSIGCPLLSASVARVKS